MASLLYDLPRLVDLSLGTPESGTVNFNVLHALLHTFVQLLQADNVRVELVGTPICMGDSAASKQKLLTVKEYKVEPKGKDRRSLVTRPLKEVDKIFVVKKWSKEDDKTPRSSTKPSISQPVSPSKKDPSKSKLEMHAAPSEPFKLTHRPTTFSDRLTMVADIGPMVELAQRIAAVEEKIEDIFKMLGDMDSSPLHKNLGGSGIGKLKTELSKTGSYVNEERTVEAIKEDIQNLRNEVDQLKASSKKLVKNGGAELNGDLEESESELSCAKLGDVLNSKIEDLTCKFIKLTEQLLDVEKIVGELDERLDKFTQKKGSGDISIEDIRKEIINIKISLETIVSETSYLTTEHEKMKSDLDYVTAELDHISKNKIERDEMDELLDEKANFNMLQSKVSKDEFEASKRDWQHNFVQILQTLQEREVEMHTALEKMRISIDDKVASKKMDELGIHLETGLQALDKKIGVLCEARKDPEAAGTRVKVLKDVNCISCSQKVIMRTEEASSLPRREPMPGHRSIRPFLTYELDSLRKQAKNGGISRNLHHYESMLKSKGILTDEKARQVVSRYCGGSHTVITPQDRVDRGRCKKLHGAKIPIAKCTCADPEQPEPPPGICDEQHPKDTDVCVCSSEEDLFENCMTAQQRRCLEIDAERRAICKMEQELKCKLCKIAMAEKEELEEVLKAKDKCQEVEKEQRERCMAALARQCTFGIRKEPICQRELDKYSKCTEIRKPYKSPYGNDDDIASLRMPRGSSSQLCLSEIQPSAVHASKKHNTLSSPSRAAYHETKEQEIAIEQNENVVEEIPLDIKDLEQAEQYVENVDQVEQYEQAEQPEQPEQTEQAEQPEEAEEAEEAGYTEMDAPADEGAN